MTRVTIQTPSRLHFGLLGWGPGASRQFGGVGLMVQEPGLALVVERASGWSATGPLASRSLEIARAIVQELIETTTPVGPFRIDVLRTPDPHVGLGSGTQLGMALARALTLFAGIENPTAEHLARLSGRGRRSGIGIHGFFQGGLIVDGGRNSRIDVPTHILHLQFPAHWSVLLILPDCPPGMHGPREVEAFESLPEMPQGQTERLCRLVLLGLIPSVIETDLPAFGEALEEIQEIVGRSFAAVQHGRFASPKAEAIVQAMRSLGLRGLGQSSWGPCLYGFTDLPVEDRVRIRETILSAFDLTEESVYWTAASRGGARATAD